ncbi:hypothetical protein [Methanolobus profundi]|uniref:Uncharacterized protein n=1 Tax=Methanolobus profundi TaxID=487685 RepID=A0A1I4TNM5_9EURY|nr:hypothetical protein [Methanolobus profundi]SFM78170.1 hypothetical protein SAMN04488696_2359 [Methanolobus profundi]
MKHRFMKVLACLSLVVMVLGAVTPGALADDAGTTEDAKEFGDHPMMHGPKGDPGMSDDGTIEAMEFDSEEEELAFFIEKGTESINNRIEMLQEMLDNIDEIEDENITEETIEEEISELEALLDEIENVTTMDELKEIMQETRGSMSDMKGDRPEMEEMVFDSDEEEMAFLVERETESINKKIEMLSEMLENIDEIEDENITEEIIEEQITNLETLLEDIENVTTLDELKEILEEYRESNPQPRGHRGEHRPGSEGSGEE